MGSFALKSVVGQVTRTRLGALALAAALAGLAGCDKAALHPPSAFETGRFGDVDAARLAAADKEPGNWFTNGRDEQGSYFSPLKQIEKGNVDRLGFAWEFDLGTQRGQEGTPIVVDGVMFAVGNWGRVYALNAADGKLLWSYDPEPDGQYGRYACCDVVQRGLSVWKGRVYAGSTDGYLHAIDAKTGRRVWRADTLPAEARTKRQPYTSSGAPQIAGDAIVIGNGGADYGVRGFVTAFDLETGKFKWRFFTVPRDPALGPQDGEHLEAALKTWDPKGSWPRYGGGGTVWDGMAYDPELDLLYVGTGNSSPYDYKDRSPSGGDNLYLASILAISPKTGKLAWYFQQVPGERWDYTSTAKFVMTDVKVGTSVRKVILQAPKNGFLYALDRKTGELLSAKPFVPLNWTTGLDAKGRPAESPAADYTTSPKLIFPGFAGGHNWQPMSLHKPSGRLVIPAYQTPLVYVNTRDKPIGEIPGLFTILPLSPDGYDPKAVESYVGPLPSMETLAKDAPGPAKWLNVLEAIDPISGAIAWRRESTQIMAGGVLTTAPGLVFAGRADGVLQIFDVADGKTLKEIATGTSIMAAPSTYAVDGVQYVAVQAGYGGGGGFSFPPYSAAYKYGNQNRIIVFKLGGGRTPIPEPVQREPIPEPPALPATAAQIQAGDRLFLKYCSSCHAFGPGLVPDLRRMAPETHEAFEDIVLRGLYVSKGMGRFDDVLSSQDAQNIRRYIVAQAKGAVGRTDEVGDNLKKQ